MVAGAIPVVETERLLLRSPIPADLDPWAAAIANPEVVRYLPRRASVTPRERAEYLVNAIGQLWRSRPLDGFGWVITPKADGQFAGWCAGEHIAGTTEGELVYILDQPHWGQGFATEAARAMVRFGFENTTWDRLVAAIVPGNVASRRVLEHLGFVYEKDVNYYEMSGDASIELDSPMVPYFVLRREQFVPGDAFYCVRRSEPS